RRGLVIRDSGFGIRPRGAAGSHEGFPDALRLSGLRGYALWRSVDLGEAARAAVRSPDKAEGRIRGGACQPRADACREPVPGCASLIGATGLRVGGVQPTWPKRRGPQFVARIRPKAASGEEAHANRGRTPAGSLFPDALRLSGLRGYALVEFSRPG